MTALINAFEHEPRPLVKRYIVDALGRIGHRAAVGTLQTALQDPDEQIRQSAVVALSTIGGPQAEDALITHAANETSYAVKAHLAPALGRCKSGQALDQLNRWTGDKDPVLKRLADEGIQKHRRSDKK